MTILGRQFRPRDKRGRRVPRLGTNAAAVYALMIEGRSTGQIALALEQDYNKVAQVVHQITHPDRTNLRARQVQRRLRRRGRPQPAAGCS